MLKEKRPVRSPGRRSNTNPYRLPTRTKVSAHGGPHQPTLAERRTRSRRLSAEVRSVGGLGGLNTICGIGATPNLTVTIDGCDFGVPNSVLPDGRTTSDT